MSVYRITFESVFEIEAEDESQAIAQLPDTIDWEDGDIVEVEEL